MLKIILLISLISSSCDQFKDPISENAIKQAERKLIKGQTINIDCTALFKFGETLLNAQFKNNGRLTHNVTGFQIIKARSCPKLRFKEKVKVEVLVNLAGGKIVKCFGDKKDQKIVLNCPKI